jgi:hypothetical protein
VAKFLGSLGDKALKRYIVMEGSAFGRITMEEVPQEETIVE